MFNFSTPINRKHFWLSYLGALALYFIGLFAIDVLLQGNDAFVDLIAGLALMIAQFRLIYLRAVDVGYAKPGWMTAGCIIPIAGIFFLLSIGCLPTGSRSGSQTPALALA
jgi:uncharacterized membrane protein YhaH (DUF805 family)